MQLLAKYVVFIVGLLLLSACATSKPPLVDSNDQLPMYGSSDRQADPGLHAADDKLAAELIQRYGSLQAAVRNLLDQGVRYFKGGDYATAMRSFNQAWLMDPNSPEPFWGFAVVYDDQGKSCMAKAMVDRALDLNLSNPAELADAGRIYTYCAVSDATLSADDRRYYFEQAEELYFRAVSMAPTNPYLFGSWAIAHYWQGNYADAWKMTKKQQALGGRPGESFLSLLRAKMPEPRR
jgi:Tfp pilus assembly protein PilF